MTFTMTARRIAASIAAAALATTLAACSSVTTPAESSSTAASNGGEEAVSGTVSLLTPIFEGSSGKALLEETLLPQFYEQYPDVDVNVDYTSYSRLNEKLTTSVASGLVPDVMIMGVGWIEQFAENGVLVDLSANGITAEELSTTMNPTVVNAGVYNDKLYAIPIMLGAVHGVARMDLLAEAGYDQPPQTVEELREMAKALTIRDDTGKMIQAGFDVQSIDLRQVFQAVLYSQGGTLFNSDNTAPEFNSPAGVSALELMTDLILVDKVEDVGYSSTDEAVHPVVSGRAAMGIAPSYTWTEGENSAPEVLEHLEPFLLPGSDPGMFFGGSLATASASSKNPEATQALLEFLQCWPGSGGQ